MALTRGYVGRSAGGGSGPVSASVAGEEPSGAINGANAIFLTTAKFVAGTEKLYLNGIRQRFGLANDYTRSESVPAAGFDQVVFTLAPRSGDVVLIDYDTP